MRCHDDDRNGPREVSGFLCVIVVIIVLEVLEISGAGGVVQPCGYTSTRGCSAAGKGV